MTFRPKYDRTTKKFPENKKSPTRVVLDSACMLIFILMMLRLALVHEKIYIGGRIPLIDDLLEGVIAALENLMKSF